MTEYKMDDDNGINISLRNFLLNRLLLLLILLWYSIWMTIFKSSLSYEQISITTKNYKMDTLRRFGCVYKNVYLHIHKFSTVQDFASTLQRNQRNIRRMSWRICVLGCAVFTFQRYVACSWVLEGNSNKPTFMHGDIVLVIFISNV